MQGTGFQPSPFPASNQIDPEISITQIMQIHFRYFHSRYSNSTSTSGFSKSFQINANTSHTLLIVALHCYRLILANTYFSQRNLIARLYVHVLRSVRNLHHRIAPLRAKEKVYNVDLLWIRGFPSYRVSNSQNFDPGFGRTTGPPGTLSSDMR